MIDYIFDFKLFLINNNPAGMRFQKEIFSEYEVFLGKNIKMLIFFAWYDKFKENRKKVIEELNNLSFLNGKFTPTALPDIYAPRHKLLTNLYGAAEDGFIYITAPAGSGKTVSALLWLSDSRRDPVWIGLDGYDNTLSVFYKLIATGLYSTQPDNENMKAILNDSAFSASPVEHTISLISEMYHDDTKRALVLDDMHLITSSEIFKSLPFVLKRLPQSFVTLILSRAPLPEGFDKLIKHKREIITSDQLRFTKGEIRDYFKSLGLFLTPEETEVTQIATDGWAIGVNAVAQSGDFHMKQGNCVFAHFFEMRIWNTWDADLRDFCLRTSVLDEFDAELAQMLTGHSDAEDIMENLARSNSFISRLHDGVYRYHHLLQEFLREKAECDGIDTATLYKLAANYYIEKKDYSMALRFWINGGDYKGADKFLFLFMFENHHGDIPGYVDFLRLYFIRDFPPKAFSDFPALHVCCAWYYYMTGQYKEYERHADEGYRHIVRIARYHPKFVEFAMLMYSVDHRSEMLDKIKQFGLFGKLVKGFTKDGIIRYIASCTHNLPYAHRSSFDYSEALRTPENVAKIRKSAFVTLLGDQSEVVISLGQTGVYYDRNDLDSALREIRCVKKWLTSKNSIELQVAEKFLHHSILLKLKRYVEAASAMDDLIEFVNTSAPFFYTNLEAYKTKLRLLDGDQQAARIWLDNYYVVNARNIELYMVFQHFTTARAYMVLGDTENARRYLKMLCEFGQNLNRVCDFCEASILLAALDWVSGSKKEAATVLATALEKLQRYDYKRPVIDEGAAVLPVLKRIAVQIKHNDYSGPLLQDFINEIVLETHRFARNHKGVTANYSSNQKMVKLSKQQMKMLTLLAKGYSNAMIVEETGLKITTVKTHTYIAYQKLGVNNMTDAVLKAKELGLLNK